MFSFDNQNPDLVYVFVPEWVRTNAKIYAEKNKVQDPYHNYAGRSRSFSAMLLDCICGWAFSKWCTQMKIWHECNYCDDNDVDVIVEDHTLGLSKFIICGRFASDLGLYPGIEGIRISNYRLEKEDTDFYLSDSFDGQTVTFYGLAEKRSIQQPMYVWDMRPMIFDMPAEDFAGSMDLFKIACKKTDEKQEIFHNLFTEKK